MAVADIYKKALAAFDAGNIPAAEGGLLQIRPEHGGLFAQAQLHLGKIYQHQGNLPLAEQSYRTAARQASNPDVVFQLSEFFFQQKRYVDAEPILKRIISMDPKYTDAYIRLGMIQRNHQQLPDAIRSFEQAIANDQRAIVARYMLAQLCFQTGNLQRSLSQLYVVLQLQPDYVPARILQADLLQRMGDHRQALVELCQIVALGKADANIYTKLGSSYLAIDDDYQAVRAYEKAFALNPALLSIGYQAATMREAMEQPMKALPLYQALSEDEEYRELALLAIERMEEALSQFNLGESDLITPSLADSTLDEEFIPPPVQVSTGTAPLRPPSTAPLTPAPAPKEPPNTGILGAIKKQGFNFFKHKLSGPNT